MGDPFNSDPNDPEVMSEDVRNRLAAGENLPVRSQTLNPKPFPRLRCRRDGTDGAVCGLWGEGGKGDDESDGKVNL